MVNATCPCQIGSYAGKRHITREALSTAESQRIRQGQDIVLEFLDLEAD